MAPLAIIAAINPGFTDCNDCQLENNSGNKANDAMVAPHREVTSGCDTVPSLRFITI